MVVVPGRSLPTFFYWFCSQPIVLPFNPLPMLFSKDYLEGFYRWTPETDRSLFDGDASRRLFDRRHGNQVLFIINLILDVSGNFSVERGKQIEKLIIDKLPFIRSSELTVFNWLQREISRGLRFAR